MSHHHAYVPQLPGFPESWVLTGDAALHLIRVRRAQPGDAVRLTDGSGQWALATLVEGFKLKGEWAARLQIEGRESAAPATPRVRVYASSPKGDRLDWMVDQISQAGAASWSPLLSAHTVVEPRPTKLDRLERLAIESLKQSGRAWVLSIHPPIDLLAAIAECEREGSAVVVAEAGSTDPLPRRPAYSLFIGPEGGWRAEELASLRAAAERTGGASIGLGPHILRVETAAVLAVGRCFSM